jgi:hypothetical protein
MGFQVLCSLVDTDWHFRGVYYLHHYDLVDGGSKLSEMWVSIYQTTWHIFKHFQIYSSFHFILYVILNLLFPDILLMTHFRVINFLMLNYDQR